MNHALKDLKDNMSNLVDINGHINALLLQDGEKLISVENNVIQINDHLDDSHVITNCKTELVVEKGDCDGNDRIWYHPHHCTCCCINIIYNTIFCARPKCLLLTNMLLIIQRRYGLFVVVKTVE